MASYALQRHLGGARKPTGPKEKEERPKVDNNNGQLRHLGWRMQAAWAKMKLGIQRNCY